jgi:hypothetical protein
MAMTPRLIMGYLHHARAADAIVRLEQIQDQALPNLKAAKQRLELDRLVRQANGESLTIEEEMRLRQAGYDASWNALRGILPAVGKKGGQPNVQPGERVIIPADL